MLLNKKYHFKNSPRKKASQYLQKNFKENVFRKQFNSCRFVYIVFALEKIALNRIHTHKKYNKRVWKLF